MAKKLKKLKKIKNRLPGHISEENHNLNRNKHPHVPWGTVYKSQDMETTYRSINR